MLMSVCTPIILWTDRPTSLKQGKEGWKQLTFNTSGLAASEKLVNIFNHLY